MRRLLVLGGAAAAGALAVGLVPGPAARAVGSADALGTYELKLRGEGFDRDGQSGRIREGALHGDAVLSVTRADASGDPRNVHLVVQLDPALVGSVLDLATPTPQFESDAVLVGDWATAIAPGQPDFVNVLTVRFLKKGRRISGWWSASFPGADADKGFAAAVTATFKGRRVR